ncbi:MAG: ChpB-ChpS toxin-antitoxin system antitoxin [Rubrivivax sp.]|nr:ChpB-ChpS toxin-antitoxin system antitoxin [Rubrivivax sp.]
MAVLPPAVLKDLGLAAGQAMTLDTNDLGQIVLARKRKYVLADLIAQCDRKAPPPADLALWDAAKPAGQEVW